MEPAKKIEIVREKLRQANQKFEAPFDDNVIDHTSFKLNGNSEGTHKTIHSAVLIRTLLLVTVILFLMILVSLFFCKCVNKVN